MSDDARKHGAEGGKVRAKKLSPSARSEIARAGAVAKWQKEGVKVQDPPLAICGSDKTPLRIGDIEIPCYVLADGRRVLSQRGLQGGIGLSRSGGSGGARRVAALMDYLASKGIDTRDLSSRVNSPILFIPPTGAKAHGYEATILPDICAVIIEASRVGRLLPQQAHLAERCAILQHGFATVGIIALVDAATGYEKLRPKLELQEIIQAFVRRELRPWVRRFPFEFYEKIYKLKGWDISDLTPNSPKPLEVGRITDDLIYKRLAPGVRTEVRRLTPRNEKGYLRNKLHSLLTDDIGIPKLDKHISIAMALMEVSPDWSAFMRNMDKVLPVWNKNYELALNDRSGPAEGEPATRSLSASTEPQPPS